MAIGIVIALVLVPAAIIVALMMKKKTSAQPVPAAPAVIQTPPNIRPPQPKTTAEIRPPVMINVQASQTSPPSPLENEVSPVAAPEPPRVPAEIDVRSAAVTTAEDRRERILAGISENIRKS